MKFLLTLSFVVASMVVLAQSADEEKLTATVKEFHQALVKKNTVSINQQTDKALSYGHSNGWVESKADLIKDLETGYMGYQVYKADSMTVLLNGSMANVRYVADVTAALKGIASNFRLKVLEVWVKKGNRWVLFARQAVKV